MPRVSDAHKQAVRQRILDAALTCLRRNGYQDVSTREILAEAGLSTGTFYNYFPSKSHLYEALAEAFLGVDALRIAAGHGDLERADGGDDSPVGNGLFALMEAFARGDDSGLVKVAVFRSRMAGDGAADDAVARLDRWVLEAFTPLVRAAQQEGYLRPDLDADALVELLDLIWDAMGRRVARASFQTGYGRVAQTLLEVLRNGVLAPDSPPDAPAVGRPT